MIKHLRNAVYRKLLKVCPLPLLKEEISNRQIREFTKVYSGFLDGKEAENQTYSNPISESTTIMGELVKAIRQVAEPSFTMLLPGEMRAACHAYSEISGIDEKQIFTAGLHEDMDFQWNYEESPPADLPKVDLIASHAMIEHVIDPYKHIKDCYALLKPGGYMIFHTVMPGFQYHRHPVDCVRYFPDWFEEVGKRLGATIISKSISTDTHIVYAYQKPV